MSEVPNMGIASKSRLVASHTSAGTESSINISCMSSTMCFAFNTAGHIWARPGSNAVHRTLALNADSSAAYSKPCATGTTERLCIIARTITIADGKCTLVPIKDWACALRLACGATPGGCNEMRAL